MCADVFSTHVLVVPEQGACHSTNSSTNLLQTLPDLTFMRYSDDLSRNCVNNLRSDGRSFYEGLLSSFSCSLGLVHCSLGFSGGLPAA